MNHRQWVMTTMMVVMAMGPIKQLPTLSSRDPMTRKTLTRHRRTFEMFTGLQMTDSSALQLEIGEHSMLKTPNRPGQVTLVAKYNGVVVGRRTTHVPYTRALILQGNENVEREHGFNGTDPIT